MRWQTRKQLNPKQSRPLIEAIVLLLPRRSARLVLPTSPCVSTFDIVLLTTTARPVSRTTSRKCAATWSASSRVGHSTNACKLCSSGAPWSPSPSSFVSRPFAATASRRVRMSFRIGSPKARVLPDPVSAAPMMSFRPRMALGRTRFWIGVGS